MVCLKHLKETQIKINIIYLFINPFYHQSLEKSRVYNKYTLYQWHTLEMY